MSGVVVGILSVGRYTKLTLKVSEHGFEVWREHWPVKNNDKKMMRIAQGRILSWHYP